MNQGGQQPQPKRQWGPSVRLHLVVVVVVVVLVAARCSLFKVVVVIAAAVGKQYSLDNSLDSSKSGISQHEHHEQHWK